MTYRVAHFPISVAALLALCAGFAASGILSIWLAGIEHREADRIFQRRADVQMMAVEDGLQDAAQAVTSINSLFATVGSVSRQQFHLFTQPLLERFPYVRAFTFQRIVSGAERSAFEAARRTIDPDFTISEIRGAKSMPAGARARYRVIDYVEPMHGNEAVFGLDTASLPDYDSAIARSIATGRPAATGLFRLLREVPLHRGFAILMPVYQPDAAPNPRGHAGSRVRGFTSVIFDTTQLFATILQKSASHDMQDLDVRIYSGDREAPQNLAFKRIGVHPPHEVPLWSTWLFDQRPANRARTFQAAGRQWHVEIATTAGAIHGSHLSSWLALLGGALVSTLIAAYLQMLAMRNAQLAHANASLINDIAARREAERALRRSQVELRELAAHQERVREDERKRIAREIHDDLGQNLLALRLDVTTVEARSAGLDSTLNTRVRIVLNQIDATMKSVRAIINNLRPPVLDLGLQAALEWLAAQFQERSNIACTLKIDRAGLDAALGDERATAIFRIVQESLSNVARHAHASKVEIGLRRDDHQLFVTVVDNGVGSVPGDRRKSRSFGLVGIKERALALGGEFRIDSEAGMGTVVTFSIAIDPREAAYVPERRQP